MDKTKEILAQDTNRVWLSPELKKFSVAAITAGGTGTQLDQPFDPDNPNRTL